MNAEDLRTIGSGFLLFHHFRHIFNGFKKNRLHLGDRRRKKGGNTFSYDLLCPVFQPVRGCVIGIPAECPVTVNVDKAGHNPQVAIVNIGGNTAVFQNLFNSVFFNPYGSLHKTACHIYSCTLYNHDQPHLFFFIVIHLDADENETVF